MFTRRVISLVALAAVPLAILGVFFALPVAGIMAHGLWVDGSFSPSAVLDTLTRPRTGRVVWFTGWTAGVATALSVLCGLPVAFVLYRLSWRGAAVARAGVLVPFVLPTVVVGVAFRQLLRDAGPLGFLGLDGTPAGIVAALVFFNISVVTRAVGSAWAGMDARPGEAAAALGATPFQVWRTVTLPALRPALVSSGSVVFLFCATAFGVVLTMGGVRYATVETEIYLLTTNLLDLRGAAALSLVQLVAVTGLLALAQRVRPAGTHGSRVTPNPRPPRRGDAVVLCAAGCVLIALAVPFLTLITGSLRVHDGWGLDHYRSLGTATGALVVPVTAAMGTSLRTAVDATWMSVGLGLTVALLVTRRSRGQVERRLRAGLDSVFMLPLGVSAVTVGFGFLITLDRPPLNLRDSPILVPIAQALVALPLVVRTIAPVLAAIDDRQRQAAMSLGAGPLRALLTVDLPAVWRPLLAASGFAFAVSLGEFGATSFLARDTHPTVPVVIYRLIGLPGLDNYGMALAASVLLAAMTALVVLTVERLRVPSLGAW